MRIFIDSNQQLFFRNQGWLELESVFTEEEALKLVPQINSVLSRPGGNPFEKGLFFSRTFPDFIKLIRRKKLGEVVTQLVGKKPLCLSYDHVFYHLKEEELRKFDPILQNPGTVCALLVQLNSHPVKSIFFKSPPISSRWLATEGCHLLLVFSSHNLDKSFFPVVSK